MTELYFCAINCNNCKGNRKAVDYPSPQTCYACGQPGLVLCICVLLVVGCWLLVVGLLELRASFYRRGNMIENGESNN